MYAVLSRVVRVCSFSFCLWFFVVVLCVPYRLFILFWVGLYSGPYLLAAIALGVDFFIVTMVSFIFHIYLIKYF